jgi:hypothetical protein
MQTCTIGMLPGGLELRWEDESKTLQTRVFLKSQVGRHARTCPAQRPERCSALLRGGRPAAPRHTARTPEPPWPCRRALQPLSFDPQAVRGVVGLLQAFAAYDVTDQQSFGVHFGQLVETLTVFASSSDERLEIRYPGPNGELQLE